MKEFRLVIYMNAPASRGFYGGRGGASPLAYYCHLLNKKNKKPKVFLGGPIVLQGLGKYHGYLKEALEKTSKPLKLPKDVLCDGEHIRISNTAFIYQNDDPLLSTSEGGIYWTAKIDSLGLRESFSEEEPGEFTLDAVKIGLQEYAGKRDETSGNKCVVLASRLVKLREPLPNDLSSPLKVYGGSNRERKFWGSNGKPTIPRHNVFVHMTTGEWRKYDKKLELAKRKKIDFRDLIDSQIKNTHISESLVHEMLRIMFAREGWWVNYEVPTGEKSRGRIDFLIKRTRKEHWRLIEVKLLDNPDAVTQLRGYINAVTRDVKDNGENSHFWLLWKGSKGCKPIKGVIVCAPGGDTTREARKDGYDVWTYKYTVKHSLLGIEVRHGKKLILRTR
jgi:hypothetical protein